MDNKKATLELGTKPVGKLLAQYALPAIIAMTAASLYNIIDRVFIGQVVGPMAISGLAITFPFMILAAAFGAAVGVGAATTISVKLGQKDYESAENTLGNTITLNLIIGLAFGGICLLFLDPILRFFGASDATLPYARDFMQIILAGNVFSHMYFGMNAVLRAASKPRMAMFATIFTVAMNILLDAVFILWWHWGIKGAAFATVISQVLALCWQMKLFSNKNELLHLKRGIYKLKANLVRNIISIGISPFLMNACACIIVIFINNQLVKFGGDIAVGAYGIANSIAMIFIMFVIGLNQGMQPIAGYNYGAQQYGRMMRVVKLSIITAICIMLTGWTLAMFAPYYCARMFTKDPELIKGSIKAIQIIMMMYPFIGCQMVITNFFQCIGKVKISIFLSLSRQLLFLLPLLVLLPNFYGINGVWASMPTSDLISVIVAISIMTVYLRRFKKEM
ncbi:multi antimicrobial extrusion protein Na(+)/drug antiporter [Prevotella intermedia]|uniref:Multidrug export protein MepA n=1 Tax=Prevotella intermedia TaxID=28131 RepID=A0AAD1BJ48_PREIN|nr:MATE family efflux transporter [Prevotella intermedia]AFJ09314.1 MATE efflux family protein [Prevotella intermedia 17]APW34623.1 MATE family efflux transporter [Prevotella intermedia]BAR95666.1 multi antimicrobial extrusion protein Na(+)/drug antiporter [Prevotella intermedia]